MRKNTQLVKLRIKMISTRSCKGILKKKAKVSIARRAMEFLRNDIKIYNKL